MIYYENYHHSFNMKIIDFRTVSKNIDLKNFIYFNFKIDRPKYIFATKSISCVKQQHTS